MLAPPSAVGPADGALEARTAGPYPRGPVRDLVHDQERHMGELLALCDLSWDLHYLDFAGNRAPVATASAVQVRQPLYRSAIGRRRRHEARLGPLRRLLDA